VLSTVCSPVSRFILETSKHSAAMFHPKGHIFQIPFDLPVQSCAESFIVVLAKTNIEYWSSMLELLYERTRTFTIAVNLIEVDVLVP
jgi:hypothetical protein